MTVPGPEAAVQAAEPAGAKPSPVQREAPSRPEVKDDERDEDRPRRRSRRQDDDEEDEDRPRRRRRRDDDEENDYDGRREPTGTSGKAVAALVLGMLSLCLSFLTGIPAVILGVLSLNEIKRSRGRLGGQGFAIAGLVLGCVSLLLLSPVMIGLLVPAVQKVREAATRIQSANNLAQMALAMHNYSATENHLPEAVPDPKLAGRTKLSWRVALLPYLGQDNLYRQFHHDEPWDSPHNKTLLAQMPQVFALPNHPGESAQGLTYYRVFTGQRTPFPPGKLSHFPADFPDGLSNTILIVEAADPVPWTKPDELDYDPNKPLPRLGKHFSQGTGVALGDGSVVFVPATVSEVTLRRAIDPADGQPLGADWPR
jgi:hypothetical protein